MIHGDEKKAANGKKVGGRPSERERVEEIGRKERGRGGEEKERDR